MTQTIPNIVTSKQQLIFNQQKKILEREELKKKENSIQIEHGSMLPEELRDTPVVKNKESEDTYNEVYEKLFNKKLAEKINKKGIYSIEKLRKLDLSIFNVFEKAQIKLLLMII